MSAKENPGAGDAGADQVVDSQPTAEKTAEPPTRGKGRRGKDRSAETIRRASKFLSQWREAIAHHPEITPGYFIAAFELSLAADWETFEAFPSQATIARKVHLTEKQVRRGFRKLEELGFLETRRRQRTSKIYQLTIPERTKSTVQSDPPERTKSTVQRGDDRGDDKDDKTSRTDKIDPFERTKSTPLNGQNRPCNEYSERLPLNEYVAAARSRAPAAPANDQHSSLCREQTSSSLASADRARSLDEITPNPKGSPSMVEKIPPFDPDCATPPNKAPHDDANLVTSDTGGDGEADADHPAGPAEATGEPFAPRATDPAKEAENSLTVSAAPANDIEDDDPKPPYDEDDPDWERLNDEWWDRQALRWRKDEASAVVEVEDEDEDEAVAASSDEDYVEW